MEVKQITTLDGTDLKHLDFSCYILPIHDITHATEYLSKHTKLVTNNPGLSWCLESGISKIKKAISQMKKYTNESSQVLKYCKDTISNLNMVKETANKELDMLRYTIKRRSHVNFQKMNIESAWSDSLSQYNSTYKLLIERLEEKLAQTDTEKISKKDMSTQTDKDYFDIATISTQTIDRHFEGNSHYNSCRSEDLVDDAISSAEEGEIIGPSSPNPNNVSNPIEYSFPSEEDYLELQSSSSISRSCPQTDPISSEEEDTAHPCPKRLRKNVNLSSGTEENQAIEPNNAKFVSSLQHHSDKPISQKRNELHHNGKGFSDNSKIQRCSRTRARACDSVKNKTNDVERKRKNSALLENVSTSNAMSKKQKRDGSKERVRSNHHPSTQDRNQIHRIRAIRRLNEKNRMKEYSRYTNRSPDIREDKDRCKISSTHTSRSRSMSRAKSRYRSTSKPKDRSRDKRTEKVSRHKLRCRSHNRENKKRSIQSRGKPRTERKCCPRDDIGSNSQDRPAARHRKCPTVTVCSSTDLVVSHSTATIQSDTENENVINVKSYHQSVNIPRYFQEEQLLRDKIDAKINNHLKTPPSELQSGKEWITFLTSNCHSIVTAQVEGSNLQSDTGLDHIWEKFIRNKYEREFKEECHDLMLQNKIDYADIKQWRKEENSEKGTETLVNCLSNERKNDIMVAAAPPSPKFVDPSATEINMTNIKDYISNKLRKQYQLAQKPIDEETILIQTEEIYNKKRKIFESNHLSEVLDQNPSFPVQEAPSSLTINDVFNISRSDSRLVRGQSDMTENSQYKDNLDVDRINWNNISSAIDNIKSDSNVTSADEQGKGVSWNDVGPIY